MSFNAIRHTATSALNTSQVNIQIAASNIANSDTAGYTRKTGNQVMTSSGGLGAGVEVTSISSSADKYLLKSLNAAATELGAAQATEAYADQLQVLFGTVDSDNSSNTLANRASDFESALAQLSGTPESQTLQIQVVDALDTLSADIRALSAGIQQLRGNADNAIADSIVLVNQKLEAIHALNKQIQFASARGEPIADLEDTRNTAVQTIAAEMNVSAYTTPDNQMKIYTGTGAALLDGTLHKLDYAPAAFVTTETVFGAISLDGKDATASMISGKVGALIAQRDIALPSAQAELDSFAKALVDKVNGIYNQGTPLPAPTSLTSATTLAGTDALNGTGVFRIAEITADGTLTAYTDIDLATLADFDAFAGAINATGNFTASIDANGIFTIASANGAGIALADLSSEINTKGVSATLGFNNLLKGEDARTLSVRADIAQKPTSFSSASLSRANTLTIGTHVVGVSDTVASALHSGMTKFSTFDAAGGLAPATTSFAGYAGLIASRAAIVSQNASTVLESKQSKFEALSAAAASQGGVNVDEEVARVNELEQQYATAAQLLQILNQMFEALLGAVK